MSTTIVEVASPTVVPVTRREVLHRAADLLEEFGHCKGSNGMPHNHSGRDPLCLLGSITQAALDLGVATPDDDCLGWFFVNGCSAYTSEYAAELLGAADHYAAYGWNDDPGRTKAEVVARLRAAAEASE